MTVIGFISELIFLTNDLFYLINDDIIQFVKYYSKSGHARMEDLNFNLSPFLEIC